MCDDKKGWWKVKYFTHVVGVFLLVGCTSGTKTIKETVQTDSEYQKIQQEMCERVVCQYNVRVNLKRKDGSTYNKIFDAIPVIQDQIVVVLAGQTVFFEADVKDGLLTNLKLVDDVVNSQKTVTAKFKQMENGGMMLSLRNPFDKQLKFRMGIMPLDSESLYKTSSCPVISGGGSYEMWPYPIFQVLLADPRLLEDGEDMACTE